MILLALACTAPDDTGEVAPQATLGTGEIEWATLDEGAEMPVVQGPQGGYHLYASVRVAGITTGDPDNLAPPQGFQP